MIRLNRLNPLSQCRLAVRPPGQARVPIPLGFAEAVAVTPVDSPSPMTRKPTPAASLTVRRITNVLHYCDENSVRQLLHSGSRPPSINQSSSVDT